MKILVLLSSLLAAASLAQAADVRISGTVASVDRDRGTLIVEELTASVGPEPVVARRTIAIGRDTRAELVQRASDGAAAWREDYTAVPLSRGEITPGDFVTVIGEVEGDTVRAQAVTVVRLKTSR